VPEVVTPCEIKTKEPLDGQFFPGIRGSRGTPGASAVQATVARVRFRRVRHV
jgi:hypothetical protein